jgi:hypothetical protein
MAVYVAKPEAEHELDETPHLTKNVLCPENTECKTTQIMSMLVSG